MAGLPTNQRDQIMLLVGIVGIVGAGLYWNFIYSPKNDELQVTREHIERLDASNQKAKAIMATGSVEELQAEAKRLQDNLAVMRTLIPAGTEVPTLIDQIIGAARRTGLQFAAFAPGGTVQGETFDTQRYTMSMDGTYHQIGALLAEIGSLSRIVVPVNVNLQPATAQAARRANTRPEDRLLRATFAIQTYVVRTNPDGAP
jgi:type IV pilus assembly protein PilO